MVEALGHKLATHHPVIEPVYSADGNLRCSDRHAKACLAETNPETRRECEKPPFWRNECEQDDGGSCRV
jgi:hypothetical protein